MVSWLNGHYYARSHGGVAEWQTRQPQELVTLTVVRVQVPLPLLHDRVDVGDPMSMLPPTTSLGDAQAWLRDRVDDGVKCPCCTQLAKVYRRTITAPMAMTLIRAYRQNRRLWFNLPALAPRGGDDAKLRYWMFIEEMPNENPKTRTSGWWRITEYGERFVLGELAVPKYAHIYDGRVLKMSGEKIDIKQALKNKFDYAELMAS